MHIAEIKEDDSGELVTGFFYKLEPWPDEDAPRVEDAIYNLGPGEVDPLEMRSADGTQWEDQFDCPLDKTHRTAMRLIRCNVALFNGFEAPIARYSFDPFVIVRDDIYRALTKAGLKGLRGVQCHIVDDPSEVGLKNTYWFLSYDGEDIARRQVIIPASANMCPHCGFAPILCPACGNVDDLCRQCGKRCVIYEGWEIDPERMGLIFRHPVPDTGIVLDGSKWRGTDFLECRVGYAVTRRVVDALLKLHAYSFRALPLRTYVGSCTQEQRKELEKLKGD
jgi:hypothetical protein